MPIRINLLEEEQKAKLARKRDPVMLSVRLSVLAVAGVLVFSLVLFARERVMKEQFRGLQSDWKQREGKFAKTEGEIKALQTFIAKADFMRGQIRSRFLWAPQLELYKDVIPTTVQITRFVGRREITNPAPPAGGNGAPSQNEVIRVTLEGMTEGGRPELVVHDFLTQLKGSKRLAELVEEIKLVSLTKGNSGRRDGDDNASEPVSARFVIEIQYKPKSLKPA